MLGASKSRPDFATAGLFERRASVIATAIMLSPEPRAVISVVAMHSHSFFSFPHAQLSVRQSRGLQREREGARPSFSAPAARIRGVLRTSLLIHYLTPRTPPLVASPGNSPSDYIIHCRRTISAIQKSAASSPAHPLARSFLLFLSLVALSFAFTLFPCIYLLHFPPIEFHF